MLFLKKLTLTVTLGLAAGTSSVATQAQTIPAAVPPGTNIPAQPALAHGGQVIGGISNSVSTASTPGSLGNDGLPSLDGSQAGNVAGLISYCVRHHDSYGTTARVIGRTLAKRPDVKNDQYYSLGGRGLLQTTAITQFDVSSLDKAHVTLLCNQVTKKGQSLVGAP